MKETVRLGQIAGVRVGLNWSVLVIFLLITVGLAAGRFPLLYPDLHPVAYVLAGLAAGLVFFVSLLAHEVAHTIIAQRNGVEVDGITLWLLGGVARMSDEPADAKAAIRIAAIGPAVSVALAALFAMAAVAVEGLGFSGLVPGVFWWLALINAILAIFNMIPAGPLDGGRILRGVLWQRSGNRHRSAITAARAGRGFGWVLIVVGFLNFVGGAGAAGLWLVLIGWFLTTMARAEEEQAEMGELLGDVRVGDIMTPRPTTVPPSLSVAGLLDDHIFTSRYSTFPVVDSDGRMQGLVTLNRVKEVPADQRGLTIVAHIACPADEVPTATAEERVIDLLPRMTGCSDGRALVVDGGRVVGIVSPRDIAHRLEIAQLHAALGESV